MDNRRNRSQGWSYAKKTGHLNEDLVMEELSKKGELFKYLIDKINFYDTVINIDNSGINDIKIPSILGTKTTAKTDLKLICENISINISIKKSLGGQVYLIGVDSFVLGYEKKYDQIPCDVKRALNLFFGNKEESIIKEIVEKFSEENYKNYEIRKNRLTKSTLEKYDKKLTEKLLLWFKNNIDKIVDFCFSSGLVSSEEEYAKYLWYIDMIDTEENYINEVFEIKDIAEKSLLNEDLIGYGSRNGGTTINLPFGFVQWHQGKMQFHHDFKKIKSL